jgi:hypothetical protein
MKIKKHSELRLSLFLFTLFAAFFIFSCEKNEKTESTNPIEAKATDAGILTPFNILIENKTAFVSFVQSAQLFSLDLSVTQNAKKLALINDCIKKDLPLRIEVANNSTAISSVVLASDDETKKYKSLLVSKDEMLARERANKVTATAIIPNQATLTNLFNIIKNQSCGSGSNCITFRYAVDGCYARAHKMRQILLANGYDSRKQFVYGNLAASTGSCCVRWGYHVATLVQFVNASNKVEERIIDPSLFSSGPVTPLTWRNGCIRTSCNASAYVSQYVNMPGNVYYYNPSSGYTMYDTNYINTNCVLTIFKNLSGCSPSPAPNVGGCGS